MDTWRLSAFCQEKPNKSSAFLVKENMRKHDPSSLFLLGGSMPGDVIYETQQKSWKDGQMRFAQE